MHIKNIDSAIQKSIINDNIVTYRAIYNPQNESFYKGMAYMPKGYFSSSLNKFVALKFIKNNSLNTNEKLLFIINIKKGSKGVYMDYIVELKENEILLPQNSKFIVQQIRKGKNITFIKIDLL